MTKVILLNGPARSGKDTLATHIEYSISGCIGTKFAEPMQEFWKSIFSAAVLEDDDFVKYTDGDKKNEAHPALGFSFRSGMIDLSEQYIKPRYGLDFFGKVAALSIETRLAFLRNIGFPANCAVISDSGFKEEAVAIIEKFGAENVLLIKLYRPGYTFADDSRNYINLDEFNVETRELQNIELDQFKTDGIAMVREFVERN